MIERYLNTSKCLRVVFLLIDIRHDPSAKDVEMYRMLTQKGLNPLIIATKADKISKRARQKNVSTDKEKAGSRRRDTNHPVFRPDKGRKRRDLGIY